MGASYLFFDEKTRPLEIWAKCSYCGEWNKLCEKAEIGDFLTCKKPIYVTCAKCGKKDVVVVQRIWKARKGMGKPRKDC